ncbi:uncharacterized protein LOC133768176 [Lepus europaeus]|uniref:uncharacterized protein LOC133768176 n=1 Tax=Lepus europaeus TaxID=9983 RepID=UPI002B4648CB|nr:uncharacterized protein LOC133768176 [Lepus europaeus]
MGAGAGPAGVLASVTTPQQRPQLKNRAPPTSPEPAQAPPHSPCDGPCEFGQKPLASPAHGPAFMENLEQEAGLPAQGCPHPQLRALKCLPGKPDTESSEIPAAPFWESFIICKMGLASTIPGHGGEDSVKGCPPGAKVSVGPPGAAIRAALCGVPDRMLLLLWGSLLCWRLLPHTQGEAHSLFLRISKDQVETEISDLLSENQILHRLAKMPVTGPPGKGAAALDHLPFIKQRLSHRHGGLDLSLVGDLLSGRSGPLPSQLLQAGGLVVEDARGPEVTLNILSDSLLQVTLRCKLYLSLQGVLWLKVIKNIRIGVRLEQSENRTEVALEECHTPPGYLSIEVLEQTDSLVVNKLLELVSGVLDEALPFLLQKIVCPKATSLLNLLLADLLHSTLPPTGWGRDDFQYYVTSTEFTEEAILMRALLVTRCSPGPRAPRPDRPVPQPMPRLSQGSVADLVFWVDVYSDILSCLYSSEDTHVDPQDSTAASLLQLLSPSELEPGSEASHQWRGGVGLTISTPHPPSIHFDGHKFTVVQPGTLVLPGPSNTSSVSVFWQLLSEPVFDSQDQELKLQFAPNSIAIILGTFPAGLGGQKTQLQALLAELLSRTFLPRHNQRLRDQGLPLPNIKGVSFEQAQAVLSQAAWVRTPTHR